MGLSFLAPFFAAGAALLVAPYLIHQIRRPEREPIRFSSVMFIPNIHKEVIERKRVQHILLMLLRMLLLLLLAFAFARPYWRAMAAQDADLGPVRHVILLDTSYSMAAAGVFDRAQRSALEVIDEIESGEAVSVMTFARSVDVLAPFLSEADGAGTAKAARRAVEGATLTHDSTAYLSSLEQAVQRAANVRADDGPDRLIVHMISDFQKNGMPDRLAGWKLSPTVELDLISVRSDRPRNYAITDTHVRKTAENDIRVLGKIRNWSEDDVENLEVTLVLNGATVVRNSVSIKARSATQTSFRIEDWDGETLEGYIELAGDDLPTDNRRYFTWNPPRKTRVALLAEDRPEERWPATWFFRQALPSLPELSWMTEQIEPAKLDDLLNNPARRPKIIVACGLRGVNAATVQSLLSFAKEGGQILYLLDESMDPGDLNGILFAGRDIEAQDLRYSKIRSAQFELMSWVDLDHPIFVPFQGTRFNDFSALRFFNYMKLDTGKDAHVLARFDDDSPAMVEVAVGDGRMIVWPFALRLDWTNLPKNARFVPLLHETLAYLSDQVEGAVAWEVGDRVPANALVIDDSGAGVIQLPGSLSEIAIQVSDPGFEGLMVLREPGFFRTRLAGETEWRQVDATNVAPYEGDLTPIPIGEFQMKVASTSIMANAGEEPGIVGTNVDEEGFLISKEYGRMLLLALFAFILIESWYMSLLKA